MTDKEAYIKTLEDIIANFIKPLKHIPFNIVIKAISGKDVLKFDENNPEHKEVLKVLIQVAEETGRRINEQGIMRTRANEVGNDIERYVLETFKRLGIYAQRPKGKSAGYPDIEFRFNGKTYYLECKTFNLRITASAFRLTGNLCRLKTLFSISSITSLAFIFLRLSELLHALAINQPSI
jgi:hypothetical protein